MQDDSRPTSPAGSIGTDAAVDSRIVCQSNRETWVPDRFFDAVGVEAPVASIVGVEALAGSVRPEAHRRTCALASRIPRVRASDQSCRAIC